MKKVNLILAGFTMVFFLNAGTVHAQSSQHDKDNHEKKGMSKKGKGAIIGGVGGAVGGAILGGGKGAVIGGAAGTVGGAAVGRKKDKKKDPERYDQYSDKHKE